LIAGLYLKIYCVQLRQKMIKASLHMGVYFWGRGKIDNGKRKSFLARPDFPILAFSDSCLRQTAISCENIQFFIDYYNSQALDN